MFGVYLSVEYAEEAPPGPATERAVEAARAVGYNGSGGTDVNCDQGASEQLGLDPARRYKAVVLDFATEEHPESSSTCSGRAAARLFCLD